MENYITDFCPYPSAVPPLALYEKYLSDMTTDWMNLKLLTLSDYLSSLDNFDGRSSSCVYGWTSQLSTVTYKPLPFFFLNQQETKWDSRH